eukprot:COSAG04_NODE_1888_length_5302_cov_7.916682_2_plen_91_part_00
MQSLSEVAAYWPAEHASQVLSALVLPPPRPSPAFEHVGKQPEHAVVETVENRRAEHSVQVVSHVCSHSVAGPANSGRGPWRWRRRSRCRF